MKNKTYKTLILLQCMLALLFTVQAQAQLPNFTKVDTGAISQLWGGHLTSTCFDMDNDGDQDLFVCNSGVYINRDFSTFKNERNGLYIEMPEFMNTMDDDVFISFGDFDNDGDNDVFSGFPNLLLRYYTNDGFGNFKIDTIIYMVHSTNYPLLIDLNNDSFLDLVEINAYGNVKYNNGAGGFLGNTSLGIFQTQQDVGLHSVSWGDPDDDGDLDFFGGYSPSNDNGIPINLCYLNNGDGSFEQFDPSSPILEGECTTTCVNWVDYNNDGDMDLYVNNFGCDNSLPTLYENLGNMQFIRHDIIDEIYRYSFANSSVWGDLDNDGDIDLFISVENNEFPWPPPDTSATPFNVLYLNDGNGQFTNYLEDHPLVREDSHTAMLFDHDNDGDLDVLMSRYSWSNDGHNNLFVNEGNDNSWIVLTCEGTTSNRNAIGARVQAKVFVNGSHITQTREITPINGHLSYANLRVHFGLGDAEKIDTLLIRWPSGIVDAYLNVKANQFYRAIEDDELTIDFNATNYIQYSPGFSDLYFEDIGENTSIDLSDYYKFIKGDTVPPINGDTLTYSVYDIENPGVVQAEVNGSIISLEANTIGKTTIQVKASAEFTERVDQFNVKVGVGLAEYKQFNPVFVHISPSPFIDEVTITYEIPATSNVRLDIYNYSGQHISTLVDEVTQKGKHEIKYDGKKLPAGIYFCILKTANHKQTIKMIKL